ncbi:MAG TPA: mechanosensitive ion channel domain-containing protein [Gallionellaceae bacterium]|nr:mechanosensitive ion channel domain-containing protein [Gallionellaceae bacterium]
MDFVRDFWKDTAGFLVQPLFNIGKTDISLLRLAGLVLIGVVLWNFAGLVRRAIMRLSHHHNDPGVYLLSRISSYIFWIVGALIGLNYLGFELSSLAFMGGAVGLGLGFGLQNVLNNFVSGIIILFERTLKVGDIVELQSGLMGKVTEINLRYTRITTNDLMDILVPNSEFISTRVANWTYGELVRRLHVPFGVAYGTDKERVREAALAAALSVEGTINEGDRKPDVWLVNMGNSALEFELIVWVGMDSLTHPAATRNHYMWALETELVRHGIEIPFPQRDLHIKNPNFKVTVER